ncbi:MAG: ABC transporter permease [Calditrichae bacterium]|nr:ABC transporter permease [Calditrichia bacterium]
MLKNYLKIALRNLSKQKLYSLINVIGLAVGLACCLLIMLFIRNELNFDKFHENADRIYRVIIRTEESEGIETVVLNPFPLAEALKTDHPEIGDICSILYPGNFLVTHGENKFFEERIMFAKPNVFKVFTFPLLQGDPQTALQEPNTMVLTQQMATKYFGAENPIGKTLRLDNAVDFLITGIVSEAPLQSHIQYDFIASHHSDIQSLLGWDPTYQWGAYIGNYNYVLIPEGTNVTQLSANIAGLMDKYTDDSQLRKREVLLQPMLDIHLKSNFDGEMDGSTPMYLLWLLGGIGLLILGIACINFMNLATARSAGRAKEVGMRKTLGAMRGQLITQFIGEALLLTTLALIIAFGLTELFLPLFEKLAGKEIPFDWLANWDVLGGFLLLSLFTGLVAGAYPAFYLSAFQPVLVLKGLKKIQNKAGGALFLRKILVVLQFSLTIVLIIATMVINGQLRYMQNAELGFKKSAKIVLPIQTDEARKDYQSLKAEVMQYSGITGVTAAFKPPLGGFNFGTSAYPEGRESSKRFNISLYLIDEDYLEQFGLQLVAGRALDGNLPIEERAEILINETTLHKWGIFDPQEALGKMLPIGMNSITGEVVGVVKDFHNQSLQQPISPILFGYWPNHFYRVTVAVQPDKIDESLAHLKKVWAEFMPAFPFEYKFLDDEIAKFYEKEQQAREMMGVFSGLAIFIACLGLFGLAAFTAEQRTKEIGIRKVLGASVGSIISLLSQDFLKLVIVAFLFATPVAWFTMNNWLQDFAYRFNLSLWIFVGAGLLVLLIALFTVSFQSVRAAIANPVKSLRYE